MTNIFLLGRNSLYGILNDFATTHAWTVKQYNFDAFSENNKLPDGDLLGLHGLSMDVDNDLVTFMGMIGLATEDDENLFRLDDMSGRLAQHFRPKTQWSLKDSAGVKIGTLTVGEGTSLSPVHRAQQKPLKFLSFRAFCDHAATQ